MRGLILGAKRSDTGVSLIELMISMALTSVIIAASFQIFQEGMQLYRVNQAAGIAQSEVTKVLGVMSLDIGNAASALTQAYASGTPDDPEVIGGQLDGITFATPVGEEGATYFDPGNGSVYWQRYVGYYFQPDPEPNGFDGKLWRAYEPITSPGGSSFPGDRDVRTVVNWLDAHGTSYFGTASGIERRVVARGLSGFKVVPYRGSEFSDIDASTKIKLAYNIAVEAGDKNKSLRDSYYIRVTSRVVPRAAGGSS